VSASAIHLHPTAPLAERVLLPGDPGRALLLAQALLEAPKMFNHNRGLWGYTGAAADGKLMTIQSTGMGGPSAAIVIEELAMLGAKRLVRVGTCGAFGAGLALGDLVVATDAVVDDGASRSLGAGERVAADEGLTATLIEAAGSAGRPATIVSTDLFYDPDGSGGGGTIERWAGAGALAVEMEAATLFQLAQLRGLQAGCVLAVTDLLSPARLRIDEDQLAGVAERLGQVGAAALATLS
jgi:DeoD family purine-nucleoside phosphorylase